MDIKELLLEGATIKMSFKTRKEDWIGDVSINIFEGGFGMTPKIIIQGGLGYQQFEVDLLDAAIQHFVKSVMSKENLMYKRNMAMRMIAKDNPEIDLEIPEDFRLVENLRRKLIIEAETTT